ncbi:NAD-dependent epimerase/dehydratase family protein [Pelobium manganitolerans]|uniref:NAD-dependent epimerase/dehydratase family protein n=1 Tax=Pelobium manganitolerans TaxID=1842495 RepID=UPI003FA3CEEB
MILLTGSSGFLGNALQKAFTGDIISLGRSNAYIICDLSQQIPKLPGTDLVIHAAGKAHSVPKTEKEKQAFFDVNVTGTQNLLKGLEHAPVLPKAFVFISSVSVYGLDQGKNINEDSPLDATEAYGRSKIEAEQLVQSWCADKAVVCTILRLPLLVGDKPPGNLGAMIKGIRKGYYFNIGAGTAKKSMVLASDVANIIIPASKIGGIYNLTDAYHPSFKELADYIATRLHRPKPKSVPNFLAQALARTGDIIGNKFPLNSSKLQKITNDLTFDDSKARRLLGWNPKPVIGNFLLESE